jgi:flagellin-specific chaperone FliS
MSGTGTDFGSFLTRLAKTDMSPATEETITNLKAKLEAEKQAEIEKKLRSIYLATQRYVNELRQNKMQRLALRAELTKLEQQANDVIAGKR